MYLVIFDVARAYEISIKHASILCEKLEIADLDYFSYIYLEKK
jgi:hypothetical protein